MYCILIDAHLSDGDQLAMLDVFPLRGMDLFKVSTCACVSKHSSIMLCILIDAHLSDGDQLVMLDLLPLKGIDLFKVSTCVCVAHTLR